MPSTRFASGESLEDKTTFLFDLDGTLVDSSPLHDRAFREVLSTRAPELLATFDYRCIRGRATTESFRALGLQGEEIIAAATREKQDAYRALVAAGELRTFPMARELLSLLRDRGRAVFLATSASRGSSSASLAAAGLSDFFDPDVRITVEDVARAKPDPALFELALARSGAPRGRCVVIEDAASGAEAGRAAGLDVVLVHGAVAPPALALRDLRALHDLISDAGSVR